MGHVPIREPARMEERLPDEVGDCSPSPSSHRVTHPLPLPSDLQCLLWERFAALPTDLELGMGFASVHGL